MLIVRYGDLLAVAAAAPHSPQRPPPGDVDPLWWILWGVFAAIVAGARIYRRRLDRH